MGFKKDREKIFWILKVVIAAWIIQINLVSRIMVRAGQQ